MIDKPFKVGRERTDDDVSLFLLHEFVVQAQAGDEVVTSADETEEKAEQVEQELVEIEEEQAADAETAEARTGLSTPRD